MEFFSQGHASPTSLGGCPPLASREPPAFPPLALWAGVRCPCLYRPYADGIKRELLLSGVTGRLPPCPLEKR